MQLTLRRFTGAEVALAVFLMPGGEFAQLKIEQKKKLELDASSYDWIAPHPDAEFKFAAGGMLALDTADGYPGVGDCWEEDTGEGPTLVVQLHEEIGFEYEQGIASPPVAGKSRVIGRRYSSAGNVVRLAKYDLGALPDIEIDESGVAQVLDATGDLVALSVVGVRGSPVDKLIDNHRSVTFDAASTVGVMSTASTLTVAHTTAAQSNQCMVASANWGTGASQTLSSIILDPSGVNQALAAISSALVTITARKADLWDLVAPTTGTLNVVFTWSANTNGACSVWTCYGVDQSTPTSVVNTSSGTSTSPSLTLAGGATDEIALSSCVWNSASRTNTPDATWTSDWNSTGNLTAGNAGSHLTGGPSVVRTDTLNGSVNWGMTGISLKAASTANTSSFFFGAG